MAAARDRWRTVFHTVLETHRELDELRAEIQRDAVARREIAVASQETVAARQEAAVVELARQVEARHRDRDADVARLYEMLRAIADREPLQRERLWALRASSSYREAFEESEPLVSVVIPTYDNARLLRERSLPSVLAQTYKRLEVVVVGDGASDDVRLAVESFADARVRYSNLSYRGPYPSDAFARWLVAGVPPYNEGVRLARGSWVAPLDDDDAFRPDHIERLLQVVQQDEVELAYGKILEHLPDGTTGIRGLFPPEHAQFMLQSAIYHTGIARLFAVELTDYLFDLPYDWGLCQRMLRAGVRMRMLDEIHVDYYPSRAWRPGNEEVDTPPPEWEYVPEGWARARQPDQRSRYGWDVTEVAQRYVEQWPVFLAAISNAQPLGVAHETPIGEPVSNRSLFAHNAAMTLMYVLARTSVTGPVCVLDWGGGLGHHYAIATSAFPDMQFEWHIRELPAVCREGRRLSPSVVFHDDDRCLARQYDLVAASSSLHYTEHWRELLVRLAGATCTYLFLTRVPMVLTQPSYVALQRADAYGYATEYLGWILNRTELLDAAAQAGLELDREFVLGEPIAIAGSPEQPVHAAFLFRATRTETRHNPE
jgi:putative methyltransferase (TIGR04325 family)